MKLASFSMTALAFLTCLGASGCGADDDGLSPVQGHVYYKGKALTKGTIVFCPDTDRGGRGNLASAEIGPDGSYRLRTGDKLGAAIGWHRVTVAAVEIVREATDENPFAEHRSLLPTKYRDPDLSELSYEVLPQRGNEKDFHLE